MWDTVFPTNAHKAQQPPDALLVHAMALVSQVPRHLPHAVERGLQKLLVDQQHQVEVHRRLALRRVIERRSRDRQQAALRPDRQLGVVPFDHATPHFPVQGLSFRDKKSLATASSPILACRSRTVSSATSAATAALPPRSKMPAAPSRSDRFH